MEDKPTDSEDEPTDFENEPTDSENEDKDQPTPNDKDDPKDEPTLENKSKENISCEESLHIAINRACMKYH